MKKFITIACCLMLLSGCAKTFESDLPQKVNDLLKKQSTMHDVLGPNHSKMYYKYYLPLNMGRRESTQLGEVFVKDESTILMNFDPSAIVIYEYYNGEKNDENTSQSSENDEALLKEAAEAEESIDRPSRDTQTFATTSLTNEGLSDVKMDINSERVMYQGSYKTIQDEYYSYSLTLLQVKNQYVIFFDASIAQFYCVSSLASVQSDINAMYTIAKSISYDKEKVLENFSMKKATSSKQQSIDSLQQNLPSVGSIPELLEQMEQLNKK